MFGKYPYIRWLAKDRHRKSMVQQDVKLYPYLKLHLKCNWKFHAQNKSIVFLTLKIPSIQIIRKNIMHLLLNFEVCSVFVCQLTTFNLTKCRFHSTQVCQYFYEVYSFKMLLICVSDIITSHKSSLDVLSFDVALKCHRNVFHFLLCIVSWNRTVGSVTKLFYGVVKWYNHFLYKQEYEHPM